jgi:hypothetical protein
MDKKVTQPNPARGKRAESAGTDTSIMCEFGCAYLERACCEGSCRPIGTGKPIGEAIEGTEQPEDVTGVRRTSAGVLGLKFMGEWILRGKHGKYYK